MAEIHSRSVHGIWVFFAIVLAAMSNSCAQMEVTVDLHPFATQEYGYLILDLTCTNVSSDTLSLWTSYHGDIIQRECHQLYYEDGETPVKWWYGSPYILSRKRLLAPSESYAAQVEFLGYGTNPDHFDKDPLMYGPLLKEGTYYLHIAIPYVVKGVDETMYARLSSQIDVLPPTREEMEAIKEMPKWWEDFKTDHVKDTTSARDYILGVMRNKHIRGGVKYRVLERTSWLHKYYDTESAVEIIDTLLAMPFTDLQHDEISSIAEYNPHAKAIMQRILHTLPQKEIDPRNRKWIEGYSKKVVQGK